MVGFCVGGCLLGHGFCCWGLFVCFFLFLLHCHKPLSLLWQLFGYQEWHSWSVTQLFIQWAAVLVAEWTGCGTRKTS